LILARCQIESIFRCKRVHQWLVLFLSDGFPLFPVLLKKRYPPSSVDLGKSYVPSLSLLPILIPLGIPFRLLSLCVGLPHPQVPPFLLVRDSFFDDDLRCRPPMPIPESRRAFVFLRVFCPPVQIPPPRLGFSPNFLKTVQFFKVTLASAHHPGPAFPFSGVLFSSLLFYSLCRPANSHLQSAHLPISIIGSPVSPPHLRLVSL